MSTYEISSLVIWGLSALGGFLLVGIAIRQLSNLVKQIETANEANSISRLNTLLSIEDTIAERRLKLSESGIKLAEYEKENDDESQSKFQALQLEFDEAKQMYLNSLDRLCYCLDKDLLYENELRSEYRDVINRAISDFQEDFNTGTPYRNIKKVYEKWADT